MQFGFRKGKSTVGAIMEATGFIRNTGQNKWRAMILLDVKNAFNSANWRLIIGDLRRRGIKERLINLVCDYLTDRSLQICTDVSKKICIGVPQGSILVLCAHNMLL